MITAARHIAKAFGQGTELHRASHPGNEDAGLAPRMSAQQPVAVLISGDGHNCQIDGTSRALAALMVRIDLAGRACGDADYTTAPQTLTGVGRDEHAHGDGVGATAASARRTRRDVITGNIGTGPSSMDVLKRASLELTAIEHRIVTLLDEALDMGAAAAALGIPRWRLRVHLSRIMRRFGVDTREDLLAGWRRARAGLLPLDNVLSPFVGGGSR